MEGKRAISLAFGRLRDLGPLSKGIGRIRYVSRDESDPGEIAAKKSV
jgi:hypothetical protein